MSAKPFNNLTPAQAERLAMLAEEAGEIVQAVNKILRHGYESGHPDRWPLNNKGDLNCEIADLIAIVREMERRRDIDLLSINLLADAVWARKLPFTHHQGGDA